MSSSEEAPSHFVVTKVLGSDGRKATVYGTKAFCKYPLTKFILMSILGSTSLFTQGFVLLAAMYRYTPKWFSLPTIAAYFSHIFLSKVMEYFGMRTLIEDGVDFKRDRSYVFGQHPHGVYYFGALPHMFTSNRNPFYHLFPQMVGKIHGTAASIIYYIPFVREVFLLVGHIVVSRNTLVSFLKKKHSVGIIVGGEAECLIQENGRDDVVIEGRKGFVRLALQFGADLVPTYTFHNVDSFHISKTLFQRPREWLQRNFKMSIPINWGVYFTPLPRPVPLLLAIGKPIEVPQPAMMGAPVEESLVDEYHAKYVSELCALFERFKIEAGYAPERVLNIHEAPESIRQRLKAENARL